MKKLSFSIVLTALLTVPLFVQAVEANTTSPYQSGLKVSSEGPGWIVKQYSEGPGW